jgi:hypothetical protein
VSTAQLHCPDGQRLEALRERPGLGLNAIDHVEVLPSRRALLVHCLYELAGLEARNVRIEGGVRVTTIGIVAAHRADQLPAGRLSAADQQVVDAIPAPLPGDTVDRRKAALAVLCDDSGDFSTYTLRLVAADDEREPPPGFDALLNEARFSFMVDCHSGLDCERADPCVEREPEPPHIDYLARDYASFRRLMLDRLAQSVPDWRERNAADLGVTLVEAVSYAADHIAYQQDAAATEAYLGTARLRPSVRRHTRLLDYRLHEGCSARAWICVEVEPGAPVPLDAGARLTSEQVDAAALETEVAAGAVVFETLHDARFVEARNALALHTWADGHCCLPRGATRATLRGKAADVQLKAGDVLVLERLDAKGEPRSADPLRHMVRLVADAVGDRDPVGPVEVVEVEWHEDDALPFALPLEDQGATGPVIARANVVLADHGLWVADPPIRLPERRRPRPALARTGLTHARPYEHERAVRDPEPATSTTRADPGAARPAIELRSEGERWAPERELLRSGPFASRFVVEMEEDGRARLRFGDGVMGRRPKGGQLFEPRYRIGNGPAGNVGPETLTRLLDAPSGVRRVRNPLPAAGGTAPEALERARLDAPYAFRRQERAVTADDYAEVAARYRGVQRAAATRRWTGSWYTMFITVDRAGGLPVDRAFEDALVAFLDAHRLAGYDVEVDGPRYVPLDVELFVCVAPDRVRVDVEQALRDALSARRLPGGRLGFFHPDNLTFGQPVRLGPLLAAAMGVDGVERVEPRRFQRFGEHSRGELEAGLLTVERLEIAQLDDDPSRPESGSLELEMGGGL